MCFIKSRLSHCLFVNYPLISHVPLNKQWGTGVTNKCCGYKKPAFPSFLHIMPTYPQARYWILTIPQHGFTPYLPPGVTYIKGQLEEGQERDTRNADSTGFLHWQIIVAFATKKRLSAVTDTFGKYHAEPTRSNAADEYVWKDDTAIEGTRFLLGRKPLVRGNDKDWETIRDQARAGELEAIPADVYVRNYNSLKRIAVDHMRPVSIERQVVVFWGPTSTGKSHRAWEQAGLSAFPKDPRTKFWDGYRNQENVVIDEFRGDIDIAHCLRWFDKYPVIVEVKGSSVVLSARRIWITSNIEPIEWYPNLDKTTQTAFLRRLKIFEITDKDQIINIDE